MGQSYRIARSVIYTLMAIATIGLTLSVKEFGIYFGIIMMIGAATTVLYLFIHFSEHVNEKVIIELAADIFAGLIVFTYPVPDDRFFMLNFSFWIAIMGMIHLATGLFDKSKSQYFWLFSLSGIMMLVFGFIIVNYNTDFLGSVAYLIGIVLLYYSGLNLYLARKNVLLK